MMTNVSRLSVCMILLLAWLGHFLVDLMIGIWPVYKSMAHLNLAAAGAVVALGAFIGEGAQLLFGSLSDRGYRKAVLVFGTLAIAGSAFLAYSTVYFVMFGLYLLTCLGSGAFHPSMASLMNTLRPEKRGLLMAIFASGGSVGLASSQLIFTNVYSFFEGHTYILAIPSLFVAACLLLYPLPKVKAAVGGHPKMSWRDITALFRHQHLRTLYFAQVANQTLMWGLIFILPDALKTLGYEDWVCFGGGHMCLILGAFIMVIPAGYLADKYSVRRVLLYAGLISFVAFYLMIFFGGLSITFILLTLAVLGASLGIANPLSVALGNRLMPSKPGLVSAFLMGLVWCISEAIGPGGVGVLSTFFEDYGPIKALAILGVFFLVNIYCTMQLPEEEVEVEYVKF